jgi:hypothetical protein
MFLQKVRDKVREYPLLKNDISQQMDEISDYIMKGLYLTFF